MQQRFAQHLQGSLRAAFLRWRAYHETQARLSLPVQCQQLLTLPGRVSALDVALARPCCCCCCCCCKNRNQHPAPPLCRSRSTASGMQPVSTALPPCSAEPWLPGQRCWRRSSAEEWHWQMHLPAAGGCRQPGSSGCAGWTSSACAGSASLSCWDEWMPAVASASATRHWLRTAGGAGSWRLSSVGGWRSGLVPSWHANRPPCWRCAYDSLKQGSWVV